MGTARLDESGVIVHCAACGKANRLAYATLGRATRCGECKAFLDAPQTPIEVESPQTFDAATRGNLPALVDFWAPWCGPCKMVAPELERVARTAAGRFLVLKVNTDVQQEIAARYRIQSIPTMALFVGGREIQRIAGARPAQDILTFANQAATQAHTRA